jgi:hypothetical protein
LSWVIILFQSTSTEVMVNGCPGRRICHV